METTGQDQRPLVDVTVLGAMRRHAGLVVAAVLVSVGLALAWAVVRTDVYRAVVTVSAPRPVGSAVQTDQQYLDSQVLLLDSRAVRDRALEIARDSPDGAGLTARDFVAADGSVEVVPPTVDSSGSYGTTIITVTFTHPDPDVARLGADALAAAYDEARATEIAAHAEARLRGIDRAISQAESPDDLPGLRLERAQALIDQGTDTSQQATISGAERPTAPANTSVANLLGAAVGFGILLGAAAAFVRATRLGHVDDPHLAARVYDAPLLWEDDPGEAGRRSRSDTAALTEQTRLLARAVAHRLEPLGDRAALALVATPSHPVRSTVAAELALGLAEVRPPVLAVDGAGGTMAASLRPSHPERRSGRADPGASGSLLHPGLAVLELEGGARLAGGDGEDGRVRHDGLVVLDCPPVSDSARGVDLLPGCDTALVLVRADEPVRDHVETARWLALTGTPVLGYVFTPRVRQRPWHLARAWAARVTDALAAPQEAPHHPARPVGTMAQRGTAARAPRSGPATHARRARRRLLPGG